MTNSLAEVFANVPLSMLIAYCLSIKKAYFLCFAICAMSCTMIIFGSMKNMTWFIPIGVLGAKASITASFCFLYFSTIYYFPSQYLGLVVGFYNMIGRVSTAAAPMVAELPQPVPMATNISLCIVAIISVCFLKKVDQAEDGHQKNKESGKNLS